MSPLVADTFLLEQPPFSGEEGVKKSTKEIILVVCPVKHGGKFTISIK